MGQKCSDLQTIPLCAIHHREQHRIGLKQFTRDYQLDLNYWIGVFTTKPVIRIFAGRYVAHWRDHVFALTLVEFGLTSAWICFLDRALEVTADEIRARVKEAAPHVR